LRIKCEENYFNLRGWKQLHYEELHIVEVIKSKWMRWAGHMVCMGVMGNTYKILIRKPERKRPHGRMRQR
jgi:hypothetical protein